MYSIMTIVDAVVYLKIARREDLKNPHHKKKMVTGDSY